MAGELILIIEDNEKNMKLVRDVLQFKGYRTLEAPTAGQGIALAAAHSPDLVLMDIQLPDMDGITALKQLQANPATAGLRVVAVTAFAMKEDEERIRAAGFLGYLTKPLDIKTFPDRVRQFCDGAG
ncbi:MAG TPA: response regulator [Chloroflexota bacterium]|nr:response regulator [Chloroflexota bacterium]